MGRIRSCLVWFLVYFFVLSMFACSTSSEVKKPEGSVVASIDKSSDRVKKEKELVIWQVPSTADYAQDLKQRVTQYWLQFVKREWGKNYAMETPSNRQSILLENYQAYFRGGWHADHVVIQSLKKIDKQDGSLVAGVSIQYRNLATTKLQRHSVQDRWQKVNNKWHHVFYDPLVNLSTRK